MEEETADATKRKEIQQSTQKTSLGTHSLTHRGCSRQGVQTLDLGMIPNFGFLLLFMFVFFGIWGSWIVSNMAF